MKTLQIATVGEEIEMIKSGIRNFPTQKLILLAYKKDKEIGTVNLMAHFSLC